MFSVGVDFSGLPLSDSYLLHPENYVLKDKDYALSISKISKDSRFTHLLTLTLNNKIAQPGQKNMEITLHQDFPSWIEKDTDLEGLDINSKGNMRKTYGLKYLLEGIYEAYTYNKNVDFSNVKVIIN
jgi:hypothetical protein